MRSQTRTRHPVPAVDGPKPQRGAAAVELALVLPILVVLLFGIIEFTRAYNARTTMTHAAREGARTLAVRKSTTEAQTAVANASTSLRQSDLQIATAPASGTCTPGQVVSVTLNYHLGYSIPLFRSGTWNLTEKATMQCGG